MGCDISVAESGITHAGRAAFISALDTFDGRPACELTCQSFAKALLDCGSAALRSAWSESKASAELKQVVKWFSSEATFCNEQANVRSVLGDMIRPWSRAFCCHMQGLLGPGSLSEFLIFRREILPWCKATIYSTILQPAPKPSVASLYLRGEPMSGHATIAS